LRRNQNVAVSTGRQEGTQQLTALSVVEHQQPPSVTLQPSSHRGDDDLLVGIGAFWELKFMSQRGVVAGQRAACSARIHQTKS
jgi:hypothetical protein